MKVFYNKLFNTETLEQNIFEENKIKVLKYWLRESLRKIKKTTALITIFAILTIVALMTCYVVHQTPLEEAKTKTLCTYEGTADYNYLALIKTPNLVYENKSVIGPEYQTLYTRLVRHINLTLTFSFNVDQPLTGVQINYTITRILKAPAWTHKIDKTELNITSRTRIQISLPTIDKALLDQLKAEIDAEVGGTSTTAYSLEISPTFTIRANTTAGKIFHVFTPTLTVSFQKTEKGEIIVIEPLHQSSTGSLVETEKLTHKEVVGQRYASYVLIAAALAGLTFSTFFHAKTKPKIGKALEKVIAPYRDLVIETLEIPKTLPPTTITVKDLKELAKIAEILAKPILHMAEKQEHTFYIIDEDVMYRCKMRFQSPES